MRFVLLSITVIHLTCAAFAEPERKSQPGQDRTAITPARAGSCTDDADCDDGLDCTADSCDDGVCVNACADEIASYPYAEDFENGQGIWSNLTGDDFDWTRYTGATSPVSPGFITGPSSDHTTGSGWYMYIDADYPLVSGDTALLEAGCFDLSGVPDAELSFWFHMFGNHIGSLSLEASDDCDTWTTLWSLSGDQDNGWWPATVDLSDFVGGNVTLRFVGVRGSGWQGDIAIDDIAIEVSPSSCNVDSDCDDGLDCTADSCDAGTCVNDLDADHCIILGICIDAGHANPINQCVACDPAVEQYDWTPRPDGTACNDINPCTENDSCQSGTCDGDTIADCPAEPGPPAPGSIVGWGSQVVGADLSQKFMDIAAGEDHSLALKADGSIVAWGRNEYFPNDHKQALVPPPNTGFFEVDAAGYRNLCLKADGSIVAWGGNPAIPGKNTGFTAVSTSADHSMGLKTDGSVNSWSCRWNFGQCADPVPFTDFVAVAAGSSHSLGLKADGSILAWGCLPNDEFDPDHGQCNVPAPNKGFVAVDAGWRYSVGLKADGSIVAWGRNDYGQTDVPSPNTGFVALAAGNQHTLALQSDGSIVGWGRNDFGQAEPPVPNNVFVAIAAGFGHNLGLKVDGSVVAWGRNDHGQNNIPVTNTGFVEVDGGEQHNLALKVGGSIVAWGDNEEGQIDVPAPNTDFVAVAAGYLHSLGLKTDGSIAAWGLTTVSQTEMPTPNTDFVAVDAGMYHNLALKADGSIVAWGLNNAGQTDVPAPNTNFVAVAAGLYHSLGLNADGSIIAWGHNALGQADVPAPNTDFVAVAGGNWHSLGLKADGKIIAWGENDDGQIDIPAPNTDFVAVAAGAWHSLGMKADGSIVAWGRNDQDQTDIPAPNSGFTTVVPAVNAFQNFTLALKGRFGDLNSDGLVDLTDYETLNHFLAGPQQIGPPGFSRGSLDADVDVDLADVARFQQLYDGP